MQAKSHINVGKLQKRKIACPLCGGSIEIRLDRKHGKPYSICDPCGLQMSVRRSVGIDKLIALQSFLESGQRINQKYQDRVAETQGALAEIESVEREIAKLKPRTGFFSSNETAIAMRKALESHRDRVLKSLAEISEKGTGK